MARRRIILFDAALMSRMIAGRSAFTWTSGIHLKSFASDCPADMKIVGCGWDERTNTVRFAVESSEWDDIPDGMFAPEWTPTYRREAMSRFDAAMEVLKGD